MSHALAQNCLNFDVECIGRARHTSVKLGQNGENWRLEADPFESQLKLIAEEAIVGQEYVTTVLSSAKTEIDQPLHLHPSICLTPKYPDVILVEIQIATTVQK